MDLYEVYWWFAAGLAIAIHVILARMSRPLQALFALQEGSR